jgi:hypothetical protein
MDKETVGCFLVYAGAWLGCYSCGYHYWPDSELLCASSQVSQNANCVIRDCTSSGMHCTNCQCLHFARIVEHLAYVNVSKVSHNGGSITLQKPGF